MTAVPPLAYVISPQPWAGFHVSKHHYAIALAERGWRLRGLGAYFAYVEHPFEMDSDTLAQRLVAEAAILLLPASMFVPETDPTGRRRLRIAFANLDRAGIATLFQRLQGLPF